MKVTAKTTEAEKQIGLQCALLVISSQTYGLKVLIKVAHASFLRPSKSCTRKEITVIAKKVAKNLIKLGLN